jgi:MFS family permease
VIFFLASAGASSAYLTVSEIFPLGLRAQAISYFFAISQLAGGVAAPTLFAALIGSGTSRGPLPIGYLVGAALMVAGGLSSSRGVLHRRRLGAEQRRGATENGALERARRDA